MIPLRVIDVVPLVTEWRVIPLHVTDDVPVVTEWHLSGSTTSMPESVVQIYFACDSVLIENVRKY